MKFTINSKVLFDNLNKINGVVGKSNIFQVLENFLFQIQGKTLRVTASDFENTMSVTLDVESDGDVEFLIPAKNLVDSLKYFSEQPIVFNVNVAERKTVFVSSNGDYTIPIDVETSVFPKVIEQSNDVMLEVNAKTLNQAINYTSMSISTDEIKKALTGIMCQVSEHGLMFCSTDSQKLTRFKNSQITHDEARQIIIPKKALQQVKANISHLAEDSTVKFTFSSTYASFQFSNIELYCKLIEGNFPDVTAVIPTNSPNNLVVSKDELMAALRRLYIFASKSSNLIVLDINANKLHIIAKDQEFKTEGKEELAITYQGEDMQIALSIKYLIDLVSVIDSEDVRFELTSNTRPCVLVPEDEGVDVIMLLMPMQLTP
jgi:DNA polymerase-3 subunit beta